jgi:hypothetical protein
LIPTFEGDDQSHPAAIAILHAPPYDSLNQRLNDFRKAATLAIEGRGK